MEDTNYLDTQQAARILGLSAKTLARYRVTGEGPVFHRFGNRIRYLVDLLNAVAAITSGGATSGACPESSATPLPRPSRRRDRATGPATADMNVVPVWRPLRSRQR